MRKYLARSFWPSLHAIVCGSRNRAFARIRSNLPDSALAAVIGELGDEFFLSRVDRFHVGAAEEFSGQILSLLREVEHLSDVE